MRIEVLDAAELHLVDGFRFYETQAEGLGNYFLDSVYADLESLRVYAGIHALYFGFHRLLCKRFPFAVYYRVNGPIVQVYAVLDCRRRPSWIRRQFGVSRPTPTPDG